MCPSTSNSSLANVTATLGPKGNCACVDLRLPGAIGTIEQAHMSSSNLARLLFNFGENEFVQVSDNMQLRLGIQT